MRPGEVVYRANKKEARMELRLPVELKSKSQVLAHRKGKTLSGMIRDNLEQMVLQEY